MRPVDQDDCVLNTSIETETTAQLQKQINLAPLYIMVMTGTPLLTSRNQSYMIRSE